MIVIVEGIDRVGKTTFCKKLEQLGFFYFKDSWMLQDAVESNEIPLYSIGKLDTTLKFLKRMDDKGLNVVVDRCYLTEWVYGKYTRHGNTRIDLLKKLEWMFATLLHSALVYVYPEDIKKSNNEAGIDQTEHEACFELLVDSTPISYKYYTRYHDIDSTVKKVVKDTFEYNLYFASPFFRPEQVEREEALKHRLRKAFTVYSPKESCFLPPNASPEDRKKVFDDNCNAIKSSLAVFAVTDDKDMGTIWEAGYAYGIGRPVIYYAETLGNNQFNLMLAQSGKKVITGRNEAINQLTWQAIFGDAEDFRGLIE